MLKWTDSKAEMELESKIADRAIILAKQAGHTIKKFNMVMDIDACHCNGCPLKLEELLTADDGNFAHDVFGICANIDRTTGKMQNCFLPRYAKL